MGDLGTRLLAAGEGERAESFELFARTLDLDWIRRALVSTGTATVRRRKLPAEIVVWLVIGMALLRDRSITEVVHHLDLVLPDARKAKVTVSDGAIAQARNRLGSAPLKTLFRETSASWAASAADAQRWRGLAVYGVDGTTLRVADTEENDAHFGRPSSGQRQAAAYPQVRLVALMVLRSHIVAGAAFGPWLAGEQTLASDLWTQLPDRSLTIVDKGFVNYPVFHQIGSGGSERHWLVRAKANLRWTVTRSLSPGDDLIELPIQRNHRRKDPDLPATLQARAIRYERPGFRPQILLTSLLDSKKYPADEIAELYHERWELEIGFNEIKTHTLERAETLRSKSPKRVDQELWGLLIAYNLVRLEIDQVAREIDITPNRISYRHALMLVRNFFVSAWLASPGVLPKRLSKLHEEMTLLVLPPRRPRSYPRAVKIKMSSYPRKLPKVRSRHSGPLI